MKRNVSVIALNPQKQILLIKENGFYKIPEGICNPEETLQEAAERLVRETVNAKFTDERTVSYCPQGIISIEEYPEYSIVFGNVEDNDSSDDMPNAIWMNEMESYFRISRQLRYGEPFKGNEYMVPSSIHSLVTVRFLKS